MIPILLFLFLLATFLIGVCRPVTLPSTRKARREIKRLEYRARVRRRKDAAAEQREKWKRRESWIR